MILYKPRVTGSNPVVPTKSLIEMWGFYIFKYFSFFIMGYSERSEKSAYTLAIVENIQIILAKISNVDTLFLGVFSSIQFKKSTIFMATFRYKFNLAVSIKYS
jgi:hypothetical protein